MVSRSLMAAYMTRETNTGSGWRKVHMNREQASGDAVIMPPSPIPLQTAQRGHGEIIESVRTIPPITPSTTISWRDHTKA
jgi:hypothetical protein